MIAIISFPRYLTQLIFTIRKSKLRGNCKLNRPKRRVFSQIIFSSWLYSCFVLKTVIIYFQNFFLEKSQYFVTNSQKMI
jgi:hypothetical protein